MNRRRTIEIAIITTMCVVLIALCVLLVIPANAEETPYSREDAMALAQMAWGEYRPTETPEDKQQCAAAMWCVCWRQMAGSKAGFRDTIKGVCAQKWQFLGYSATNPVTEEHLALAEDVLSRYHRYLAGETLEEVGAAIPPDYLWFVGNGKVNTFRNAYRGGNTWTWTLGNPYQEGDGDV